MRRLSGLLGLFLALPALADVPDGGVDGGAWHLAQDYGCPDAPAPVAVDGGWLFAPMRVERLSCEIAGCQAERDYLRDAGFTSTQTALIAGISSVVVGLIGAYAVNRTARHLSLWP